MTVEKENAPTLLPREFSRVVLTLENVLITDKTSTPSVEDGLDPVVEMDSRIFGCELIQTSGILLKLPQVAMATGQVLFQRFYFSKSFVKHEMEIVAMACVHLASKIEECPRRIRDVINVVHHIKQVRAGKNISPLILDTNYVNRKNAVIKAERRILKELGFCVHVKHPHKLITTFIKFLGLEKHKPLVQSSWNYMNDSFRSDVFVRYSPETIACACIALAARKLAVPLPNSPAWYYCFKVTDGEIQDICLTILSLYTRSKANPDELEKAVSDLKAAHLDAKLKAKVKEITSQSSAQNTPDTSAPAAEQPSPAKRELSPAADGARHPRLKDLRGEEKTKRTPSPPSPKAKSPPAAPRRRSASPSPPRKKGSNKLYTSRSSSDLKVERKKSSSRKRPHHSPEDRARRPGKKSRSRTPEKNYYTSDKRSPAHRRGEAPMKEYNSKDDYGYREEYSRDDVVRGRDERRDDGSREYQSDKYKNKTKNGQHPRREGDSRGYHR